MSVLKVHAGVVGQLAALLVPGAGHSAEVVQDAAAAMPPGHEGAAQVMVCSQVDWKC